VARGLPTLLITSIAFALAGCFSTVRIARAPEQSNPGDAPDNPMRRNTKQKDH
jgi:hypothetical protein